MKYKLIALIVGFISLMSCSVFAFSSNGYYCASYNETGRALPVWYFYGCQKVIYNSHADAVGVTDDPPIDIVMTSCLYGNQGPFGCDSAIKDKKQYPHYYAFSITGGGANGGGLDYWDAVVLNDPQQAEGTKLNYITFCVHGSQLDLQSCAQMPDSLLQRVERQHHSKSVTP